MACKLNTDGVKLLYSRDEMMNECIKVLKERGVEVEDIAKIAYDQQSRYTPNVDFDLCVESVKKILSLRDIFHIVLFSAEVDRLVEEGAFRGPIQNIMKYDLGVFGIDEILGLEAASLFGVIGKTNFGHIDVAKPGIVKELNDMPETNPNVCHTFMDDIVGAIAASASTRVAQVEQEDKALEELRHSKF